MTLCRDHKYIMSSVIAYYKLKHWPEFLRWSKTLFISQYKIYWLLYRELQFIRTQRRILLPNSLLSPLFFKLQSAHITWQHFAVMLCDLTWPVQVSISITTTSSPLLVCEMRPPLMVDLCYKVIHFPVRELSWFITVSQRVITAGRSDCCYSSWSQCCSFCLQFLCLL